MEQKKTITISIDFSVNDEFVKNLKSSAIGMDAIILAWAPVIIDAVERRLAACNEQLVSHHERVVAIDDNGLLYARHDGCAKRYNIPSADAMKSVINRLKTNDLDISRWSNTEIAQTIKALFWVSPGNRELKLNKATFDDLYSRLLAIYENRMREENPVRGESACCD